MHSQRPCLLPTLVILLAFTSASTADEVRWRYDYTAARRESQQSGRPMLLDFSTEWCAPCRRLEKTTFRDSAVVQLLNERFIPVKLDGSKEQALVELLRVQAYPTLILAGPDGRILRNLEGFLEAPSLREHLREALAVAGEPAKRPPPVAEQPVLNDEQRRKRAAELLAQAKVEFEQRDYFGCLDRCAAVVEKFGDAPEAKEARQIIDHLKAHPQWMRTATEQLATRLAEMHLALAEHALQTGETKLAVEQLERVLAVAPGTANAELARKRLGQVRGGSPTSFKK